MNTAVRTKVFIVEDSPSIRDRLVEMLSEVPGVAVVGDAESPADAIAGIRRTSSDCVVLDYELVGGNGVEVLRALHPGSPEIVFVVLSNHANPQYRRLCLEAGASYFFDKSTEFGKVRDVIAGLGRIDH